MTSAVALTIALSALAVVATLWCETRVPRLAWLFKPLAALCFVTLAVQMGALDSAYGRVLLLGLVLCLVGDVSLIAEGDRAFLLGLGSFLCGHLAYGVAFLQLPIHLPAMALSVLPVGVLAILSLRWLWPHVPPPMRLPVISYIAVICLMLLLAGGTWSSAPALPVLVGAWGFALSDLSVARLQFIGSHAFTRLWGLPLYFASQMLLAWSVGLAR